MSDPYTPSEQPFQQSQPSQPTQPGEGEAPPGFEKGSSPEDSKVHPLPIVGLVVSIIALIFLPIGLAGVVCGLIALQQINKEPDRYRGRVLAIVVVVIGAIETVAGALLLLS